MASRSWIMGLSKQEWKANLTTKPYQRISLNRNTMSEYWRIINTWLGEYIRKKHSSSTYRVLHSNEAQVREQQDGNWSLVHTMSFFLFNQGVEWKKKLINGRIHISDVDTRIFPIRTIAFWQRGLPSLEYTYQSCSHWLYALIEWSFSSSIVFPKEGCTHIKIHPILAEPNKFHSYPA